MDGTIQRPPDLPIQPSVQRSGWTPLQILAAIVAGSVIVIPGLIILSLMWESRQWDAVHDRVVASGDDLRQHVERDGWTVLDSWDREGRGAGLGLFAVELSSSGVAARYTFVVAVDSAEERQQIASTVLDAARAKGFTVESSHHITDLETDENPPLALHVSTDQEHQPSRFGDQGAVTITVRGHR